MSCRRMKLWLASRPRGLLDRFMPAVSRRRALQGSLARLQELIALKGDIKLLQGIGDE